MPTELRSLPRRTLIPTRYWVLYLAVFQMVGWVSMLSSGADWVGSWKMAYDWVAGSLILVGPVAAGVSGVTYARLRRSSVFDLLRSGVSPIGWVFPLLKVWLAVVASSVLLAVGVTGYVVARGVPVIPAQFVNIPYLLALSLAEVSFGALLGMWLRDVWAGVAGVAATFLAFLLATTGLLPDTLIAGGTSGSLVGEIYRPSVMLVLLLSAAGLALTLLALVHARFGGKRRAVGILLTIGMAGLLLGCVPGTDIEGRTRFSRADYVCRGEHPELCMAKETPLLTERGARALEVLSVPLVEAGVDLPDRWVQDLYVDQPRDAGEFLLSDNAESTGHLVPSDVARSLAYPAACPNEMDEPSRSLSARYRIAGWIAYRNGLPRVDDEEGLGFSPRFEAWARSNASEAWVRSTYRKLRECRLRAITAPTR